MSAQWMTTRDRVAEKLRPWEWIKKLPRLGEGDALVIARTAGFGEEADDFESDLYGLIVEVDAAIGDLEAARDGGDREEIDDARETRDGAVEEFLAEIRKRLLPDVVAAEEAETERIRAEPLPGLRQ
jgi:hypothetical protein